MDDWAALRIQLEWGADEALELLPIDRLRPAHAPPPPVAASPVRKPPLASTLPPGQAGQSADALAAEELAASATTLAELRAAIVGFTLCALRDTATSLVFAEGNPAAGLMLIGDAPSADDDRAGRPFAGPTGDYLDGMLSSIGLNRTGLLLAPLIPWRPPGDRMPSPAELAACLPFLWRLIALARPRRILLLGPGAARCLLASTPRRRTRGTWVEMAVPGLQATIATLPGTSPAALRQQPQLRREAWADLRRLRRHLEKDVTTR